LEFPSVVDAGRCVVEVQTATESKGATFPKTGALLCAAAECFVDGTAEDVITVPSRF
jgi:hypothetical protein